MTDSQRDLEVAFHEATHGIAASICDVPFDYVTVVKGVRIPGHMRSLRWPTVQCAGKPTDTELDYATRFGAALIAPKRAMLDEFGPKVFTGSDGDDDQIEQIANMLFERDEPAKAQWKDYISEKAYEITTEYVGAIRKTTQELLEKLTIGATVFRDTIEMIEWKRNKKS